MLGWRGAAAVLCRRVFSSIPGLFPLDASSTSPPSCNNQNHLQISPKVPEGAKYTPGFLENLWAMEILWAWEQVGETEAISTSEQVSAWHFTLIISLDTGILWGGSPQFHFSGERFK